MALLDKIRDEIIETQKIQAALARWKLVLVAALGAAGLGIQPSNSDRGGAALLGLLPFVCLYADSLVYNSGIRVLAIARYLRRDANWSSSVETGATGAVNGDHHELAAARDFEIFSVCARSHFDLEVLAFRGVSIGVSGIVATIGLVHLWDWQLASAAVTIRPWEMWWLIVTGVMGVGLSVKLYERHQRKVRVFDGDDHELMCASCTRRNLDTSARGGVVRP
jgi:hypothetical protein